MARKQKIRTKINMAQRQQTREREEQKQFV